MSRRSAAVRCGARRTDWRDARWASLSRCVRNRRSERVAVTAVRVVGSARGTTRVDVLAAWRRHAARQHATCGVQRRVLSRHVRMRTQCGGVRCPVTAAETGRPYRATAGSSRRPDSRRCLEGAAGRSCCDSPAQGTLGAGLRRPGDGVTHQVPVAAGSTAPALATGRPPSRAWARRRAARADRRSPHRRARGRVRHVVAVGSRGRRQPPARNAGAVVRAR